MFRYFALCSNYLVQGAYVAKVGREKAFRERFLKHWKPFLYHPQSHLSNEELTEVPLYYYYYYYYYLLSIRINTIYKLM
jgi:hypothetical protein